METAEKENRVAQQNQTDTTHLPKCQYCNSDQDQNRAASYFCISCGRIIHKIYFKSNTYEPCPLRSSKQSARFKQGSVFSDQSTAQAALLSFFVPGLGQMTKGRFRSGLLWIISTCLGYVMFIVPGIVLHILCVINAARAEKEG